MKLEKYKRRRETVRMMETEKGGEEAFVTNMAVLCLHT